jgi:HemY protein
MFQLVVSFFILLLAVVLGLAVERDPGYLLISWQQTSIETSLWVGVAAVLVICFVFYIIVRLISHTRNLPDTLQSWGSSRRLAKSQTNTSTGLCSLAEGKWAEAEKYLLKGVKENNSPLMNYLAAARAAQEQGKFGERDQYLEEALEKTPEAKLAIYLTKAQLQINGGELDAALKSLAQLHKEYPQHKFTLNLLQIVFRKQRNWQGLILLLPKLIKYKVLDQLQLENLQRGVYAALLSQSGNADDPAAIYEQWSRTPKAFRTDIDIARTFVQNLIQRGEHKVAFDVLEKALQNGLSSSLLALYAQVKLSNSRKQIKLAESWLQANPNDPDLLLCLGQLHEQYEMLGKAKEYLVKSIKLRPSGVAHLNLAKVCQALNEPEAAMKNYQAALEYGRSSVALHEDGSTARPSE